MRRAWMPLVCALIGLSPGAASAQEFERLCLPQEDAGDGLSMAVDRRNRLHISRISKLSGALLHTLVYPDGRVTDAEIAPGVSLLAFNEVDDTQIITEGDRPRVCYHRAVSNTFEVAIQTAEGWQREIVHEGVGTGRWCQLRSWRRTLVAVFGGDDGRLRMALRRGADDWEVSIIDEADEAVGRDVSLTEIGGTLVAAHQTESELLRISWLLRDGWQSQPLLGLALAAGESPVALPSGGDLAVIHGNPGPPGTSDGGLLLTVGQLGMFDTMTVDDEETGGSNGAVLIGDTIALTTRYFRRNAVFGNADALRYYSNARVGFFDALEAFNSAEQRHTYRYIQMAADRFELPLIGTLIQAGRFNDMRGTALTCVWRSPDMDADAIPDAAEARYDTDPANPDTDGDGRLDGDEVLVHMTNPLVMDPLPPDAGPPPDLGIADFGFVELDAGVEVDEGVAPDEGVEPDADVVDMADIDQGDLDQAVVDASMDAAVVDAEPPPPPRDMTPPEPDDAEVVGFEPIRPPRVDQGMDATGGGGDGGCTTRPGNQTPPWAMLAGLLLLGVRRSARS